MGALVTSMMVNMNRSRGSTPASIDDFMLVRHALRDAYLASEASNEEDYSRNHLQEFIVTMGGRVNG